MSVCVSCVWVFIVLSYIIVLQSKKHIIDRVSQKFDMMQMQAQKAKKQKI